MFGGIKEYLQPPIGNVYTPEHIYISGSPQPSEVFSYWEGATGTVLRNTLEIGSESKLSLSETALDNLWNQLYERGKKVIVTCRHCLCHNAISNPACCRCGAPMGEI